MKQLQYRNRSFIGETAQPWAVWAEATIVTKEMKQELSGRGNRENERDLQFQLIDTKLQPSLVL
jgi:hypothetical protein